MITLFRFLFGKSKPRKWKCTYCGREFDNPNMPRICHDLDLKIKKYGVKMVEEIKEKEFTKTS